jgi:transposase
MKRRRFSSDFKLQCVLDILSGRKNPAQICRENSVSESALCRWRQQFIERAPKIFENGSSAVSAEAQRISDLERLVGKLTLELEASKKLLSYFPSR